MIVCEKQKIYNILIDGPPNMPDPFFADIVAVFPRNAWKTNAMNKMY